MGFKKKDTLCWKCKNAYGFCSWSGGEFIPVDGWNAIPTEKSMGKAGKMKSYCVIECPKFEKDESMER